MSCYSARNYIITELILSLLLKSATQVARGAVPQWKGLNPNGNSFPGSWFSTGQQGRWEWKILLSWVSVRLDKYSFIPILDHNLALSWSGFPWNIYCQLKCTRISFFCRVAIIPSLLGWLIYSSLCRGGRLCSFLFDVPNTKYNSWRLDESSFCYSFNRSRSETLLINSSSSFFPFEYRMQSIISES